MKPNLKKGNIKALSKNRKVFSSYIRKFYDRKSDFPNSSFYFHNRVMEMVRKTKNYGHLVNNNVFLEFVYATLSTWGMDRLDGGARLVKFEVFKKSVRENSPLLKDLSNYKINRLSDIKKQEAKRKLSLLFDRLKVMKGKKLVGVSKALHHLLPDLVPPVDGTYTLSFFYGNYYYTDGNQKEKFLEIFEEYCNIARKLVLKKTDLKHKWDTSIPKLLDNAVIGFIS